MAPQDPNRLTSEATGALPKLVKNPRCYHPTPTSGLHYVDRHVYSRRSILVARLLETLDSHPMDARSQIVSDNQIVCRVLRVYRVARRAETLWKPFGATYLHLSSPPYTCASVPQPYTAASATNIMPLRWDHSHQSLLTSSARHFVGSK